jgi:hypothetical protein
VSASYAIAFAAALVFAIGGKACTPKFEVWAAVQWLEIYAVFVWWLWVPAAAVIGIIGANVRIPIRNSVLAICAMVVFLAGVGGAAIFAPGNGACVWP